MKLENVTIYSMKVGNGHNKDNSRVKWNVCLGTEMSRGGRAHNLWSSLSFLRMYPKITGTWVPQKYVWRDYGSITHNS